MDELLKAVLKEHAQKDSKPIAWVILNHFRCSFCEIFEIDNCGSENFSSCTDYIDDYLKQNYQKG